MGNKKRPMPPSSPASPQQEAYLHGLRVHHRRVIYARLGLLAGFFALWELAAFLGWIDPFIASSPSRMMRTLYDLVAQGQLWHHLYTTLYETVIGFVLGTVLGTAIAIALWWSNTLSEILEPYLVVLNALPKTALGPVLIVWMGAGTQAIIAMALLVSLVVTILNVLNGFLSVDSNKIMLMRTFNASRGQLLRKVVLPANVPVIISALKINVGMSWVGVIVGEFLVSNAGLGYLIVYGGQVFKLDLVMASTLLLAIAAALMYYGVALLEKKALAMRNN